MPVVSLWTQTRNQPQIGFGQCDIRTYSNSTFLDCHSHSSACPRNVLNPIFSMDTSSCRYWDSLPSILLLWFISMIWQSYTNRKWRKFYFWCYSQHVLPEPERKLWKAWAHDLNSNWKLIFSFFRHAHFNRPKEVDLEGEFEPSLLNSGVYLIQLSMQVSTFAINYQVSVHAFVRPHKWHII